MTREKERERERMQSFQFISFMLTVTIIIVFFFFLVPMTLSYSLGIIIVPSHNTNARGGSILPDSTHMILFQTKLSLVDILFMFLFKKG